MNTIRLFFILALGACGAGPAATLQNQDLFFFSTHKNPSQVESDAQRAYVLTEGGVLVYDYGRGAWVDNLFPGTAVRAIRYSQNRARLYAVTESGRVLEYSAAFRRFTDASQEDFNAAAAASDPGDASASEGLTLDGEYLFLGDAVRDKYMRRAYVTGMRRFGYDHLWVLTQGLGPFLGSARRQRAGSQWFGLDEPAVSAIYPEGKNIWFGSWRGGGALAKADADLGTWKIFPAGFEFGFSSGRVFDMAAWKGFVWLATDNGVVRHDPRTGRFRAYSHLHGSTGVRAYALAVHQGGLYAGTEKGVSRLADVKEEFQSVALPGAFSVPVYALEPAKTGLWAGTQYGLFVHREEGWKTLKEFSSFDSPESYGVPVPSVRCGDSSVYWISGDKVMAQARGTVGRVIMEREGTFHLRLEGGLLYAGFAYGVTAYDLKSGLWTDFRLEDGIPGTRALCFNVFAGKLWVGTDAGVTRIDTGPYVP